jgi:hypothetical protein
VPCFRNEYQYEEFTFAWNLRQKGQFRPEKFDVTISCTYPHVNWSLQKTRRNDGPLNLFVTQNGDWMCHSGSREFKYFGCDGLITINPEYYERNKTRYQTALIPNGVDPTVFDLSSVMTKESIPEDLWLTHEGPTILMVSALIASSELTMPSDLSLTFPARRSSSLATVRRGRSSLLSPRNCCQVDTVSWAASPLRKCRTSTRRPTSFST